MDGQSPPHRGAEGFASAEGGGFPSVDHFAGKNKKTPKSLIERMKK
jgi:hypothetical protein